MPALNIETLGIFIYIYPVDINPVGITFRPHTEHRDTSMLIEFIKKKQK